MPASPAMRVSPGRGLREGNHKRGRSLESGIRALEKDDDLALFNEAQNKERETFLLQQNEDFDDIFSTKLRYFADYKLGISIPVRGESSDLLKAEGDKNDYDWLITPPETPLFRSLDDEVSPATPVPRGRPRSQPISVPRSSATEKSYRSARSSASPLRHSPSPRSVTSPLQPISRPFSAIHSSPPPTLRNSYQPRRLSPPPSKPTPTQASRASTTPRRMSTSSIGVTASSRVRGTSPVKTSRGNSTSPKVKAWQSNIPGFSLEAPPNLRTSLADRPASSVRGSSPASRNSSRSGRQSMSPTASRSISSSHSHEREQYSSYSRGSVVSSFDDEVDSLQSIPISNSDHSVPRITGSSPNNKVVGISKKPTKVLSSSAPKRSFDLALRQMDRKVPQNMFRPLLSSVPSSTFYVGKANTHHRPLTSRNSSITTSSNASSDQGTSAAIDTEESEQNHEDVTSDSLKGRYPPLHDEVFVMDQPDAANEAVENIIIEESPGCQHPGNDGPSVVYSQLGVAECSSSPIDSASPLGSNELILDAKLDSSDVDFTQDVQMCSKCNCSFHLSELVTEGDLWFCRECKSLEMNSMDKNTASNFVQNLEDGELKESSQVANGGETATQTYSDSIKDFMVPAVEEQQEINHFVDSSSGYQHSLESGNYLNSKVDVSEGTGISLVLKNSVSGRGHLVQSRSFTASNTSYEDFSYVRDSLNSMRSSIGRSSASVSSSVDLGSSRQTEMRIRRQLSMENYRHEMPPKHKRSISSLSAASGHASQVPSVTPSYPEDTSEAISANNFKEAVAMETVDLHDKAVQNECLETEIYTDVESNIILKEGQPGDSVKALISTAEELASCDNADDQSATRKEDAAQMLDVVEVTYPSSLDAISEVEIENAETVSADLQSDVDSPKCKFMNELAEASVLEVINNGSTVAVDTDPANGVLEESIGVSEDDGVGTKPKSLTLEEAADSILFCHSIVHDLAYKAADIALAKEGLVPVEPLQPFVSKSETREMRPRKRISKSKKAQQQQQRKVEVEQKHGLTMDENGKSSSPCSVISPSKGGDTLVPPKLESKCNCTIM